jgi:hypothetical protein
MQDRRAVCCLAVVSIFAILIPSTAKAGLDVFTNNVSTLWSDGGNWGLLNPPGTGDDAWIEGNAVQDNAGGVTVNSLQLLGGFDKLTLDGALTSNGAITLESGIIDLNSQQMNGASFTEYTGTAGYFQTIGGAPSSGTLNTPTVNIGTETSLTFNGDYTVNGTINADNAGQFTITTSSSPLDGIPVISGVTTLTGLLQENGTLQVNGNLNNIFTSPGFGSLAQLAGTTNVTGTVTNSGAFGATSLYDIAYMQITGSAMFGNLQNLGGATVDATAATGPITVTGATLDDGFQKLFGIPAPSFVRSQILLSGANNVNLGVTTISNAAILGVGTLLTQTAPLNPLPAFTDLGGATTEINDDLVNESGGLFSYNQSGGLTTHGTILNDGSITIPLDPPSAPVTLVSTVIVNGSLQADKDITNQNGAIMSLQGNTTVGLIDQADHSPDAPAGITNQSGATLYFNPVTGGDLTVTSSITNTDAGTTMYLAGATTIVGRDTASPLLTNTDGATLYYNSDIEVGVDKGLDVPAGNLDNNGGTIRGYGDGNIVFHGGNQENGDASHTDSFVILTDSAQFTVGPQGSSTFNNYGTFIGNGGTPTLDAGAFNNEGTVKADMASILTLDTAPIANSGTIDLERATVDALTGINNDGFVTLNMNGDLKGDYLFNFPGGTVNGDGGTIDSTILINSTGATMTFANAVAGEIEINSSTFSQSGSITVGNNITLDTRNIDLVNGGTITLGGPLANISAPGNDVVNNSVIMGAGQIGVANGFIGATNQFINNSKASLDVGPGDVRIDGDLMPINNGAFKVAGGSTLSITAGILDEIFPNAGSIILGDNTGNGAIDDGGTTRGLTNNGTLSGHGSVDFAAGFTNSATGVVNASGAAGITINNASTGAVSNFGTMSVADASAIVIPKVNFTNNGTIQLNGTTNGATLNDAAGNTSFTNAANHQVVVTGAGNNINFNANGTSILNNGTLQASGGALTLNGTSNSGVSNAGAIIASAETLNVGNGNAGFSLLTTSGTVNLNNSTLQTGGITNEGGTISAVANSIINTNGNDLNNSGAITSNGGQINVNGWSNAVAASTYSGVNTTIDGIAELSNAGTFSMNGGTATFTGTQTQTNTGQLDALNSGKLFLNNLENSGTASISDGGWLGLATLTNDAGASVTVGNTNSKFNVTVPVNGGVTSTINNGTITLDSGATSNLGGGLTTNAGSLVEVNGAGTKMTIVGPFDAAAGSVVNVDNGGKIDPPDYTSAGTTTVMTGSTFAADNFTTNDPGSLLVDGTSKLQIANDWNNNLTNANKFEIDGTVEINGGGSSLQDIVAEGKDVGNIGNAALLAAFTKNFSIGDAGDTNGTLMIDADSDVELINGLTNQGGVGTETLPQVMGWTGSPTGANALYVWNLVIGNDASIDLNGLHLYYVHLTEGTDVTFTNGAGGEDQALLIPVNAPEPATLSLLLLGGPLLLRRKRRIA